MPTVSINAYDDAHLLGRCLETVREHLPDAQIQVVDGRYETHPGPADNSTDETASVAEDFGCEYYPAGPFKSERHKHLHRVALAPAGERVFFLDSDERLLSYNPEIADDAVGRVRIFNALLYGSSVRYYPRLFYPEQLESIPRVDRFSFHDRVVRTDGITINHRADLRGKPYREAKIQRYDAEGRDNWYRTHLESLAEHGFEGVDFQECPECGRESVTRSRVTNYGPTPRDCSHVEVCTATDRCHTAIVPYEVGEFQYVPDRVREGFREDVDRVRIELAVAGWPVARCLPTPGFEGWEANAEWWLKDHWDSEGRID